MSFRPTWDALMHYGPSMLGFSPNYRVFFLSTAGRIDKPPVPIEADNDEDALRQAEGLVDGHDVELWDRGRFIVRLAAKNG